MKFDGIIFDWAGTTVDYGCFAPVQAFVEAFKTYGIEPTMEEVRAPMGMLKRDHVRTMLGMERISKCWNSLYGRDFTEDDVEQVYLLSEKKLLEGLKNFAEPKPYVRETIAALREKGILIGSTTGYTKEMMEIVVPEAAARGYAPDCWVTPEAVDMKGRPYPYMVFYNMMQLGLMDTHRVMKVGDTVSDIKEGKNAGLFTIGIIEGSSAMGLSEEEFRMLSEEEKADEYERVKMKYLKAGADAVVNDIRGILEYLE